MDPAKPGLGIKDQYGNLHYEVWSHEPEYAPAAFSEHQPPEERDDEE